MRPQFSVIIILLAIAAPLAVVTQPLCYLTMTQAHGKSQCQNPPYRTFVSFYPTDICQGTYCQGLTHNNVSGLESYTVSARDLSDIPKPITYVQLNYYNDSSCTFLKYIEYLGPQSCATESQFEATCLSKTSARVKFFYGSCSASSVWFDKTSPLGQCNEGPTYGQYYMITSCTGAPEEDDNSPAANTTSDATTQPGFHVNTIASTLVLLCLVRFF